MYKGVYRGVYPEVYQEVQQEDSTMKDNTHLANNN